MTRSDSPPGYDRQLNPDNPGTPTPVVTGRTARRAYPEFMDRVPVEGEDQQEELAEDRVKPPVLECNGLTQLGDGDKFRVKATKEQEYVVHFPSKVFSLSYN